MIVNATDVQVTLDGREVGSFKANLFKVKHDVPIYTMGPIGGSFVCHIGAFTVEGFSLRTGGPDERLSRRRKRILRTMVRRTVGITRLLANMLAIS